MNALVDRAALAALRQQSVIDSACARIAPTWPLDRCIAVNPYWGQRERPIVGAAAQLAVLAGSPLLMPRAWYRDQWQSGRIGEAHLQAAIAAAGADCTVDELVAGLQAEPTLPQRLPLATDLVDAQRDDVRAMSWRDYTTHHISQHCAAFFDQGQAAWGPDRMGGLYPSWLRQCAHDFSPAMLMGYPGFSQRVASLPAEPQALIAAALKALSLAPETQEAYLTALLMSINGWASWCAYQRWQARLAQRDDAQIVHLLAIRLAWEWLLHEGHPASRVADQLSSAWSRAEDQFQHAEAAQQHDWLWQAALERSGQARLCAGLMTPGHVDTTPPAVQAVFCIDVRSEVYRRALEAASPCVQTLGFAGFFAMFIEYRPLGSELVRPQLPGLLAPAHCVTDECDGPGLADVMSARRRRHLLWRQRWQAFRSGAGSSFSFVESCGLLYAGKLLTASVGASADAPTVEQTGLPARLRDTLRPRLPTLGGPDLETRIGSAAAALSAMGLTNGFARLILIVGHGSTSLNNPHAAGLDCGACGGQTGEVNARVLAQLLNDRSVRLGLHARGLMVPDSSWFVAALHNTTTDELQLHDTDLLPASHTTDHAALKGWLAEAGQRARAERAASLGLASCAADAVVLRDAVKARTTDWAQVRPEWGLADCAAFIVAPRSRSKHLNLAGRSFLHDYVWQRDPGFATLELIMTAPMVVTNWINMQYLASTVDNQRYGSGNKVLHNVVGGNVGVFEGNGGDLRIGLPMQSIHDGQNLRHTPLRLSVFIQAPQTPIDAVLLKNQTVRQLLDNGWVNLFRLGDDCGVWRYRRASNWDVVA
jgi:uncharacterized protein YbcC (UPF0753/DUF2309 family)